MVPEQRAPASVDTHCPYCALQCGMTLVESGDTVTVVARDFPTNKGGLCRKGWTAAALLNTSDRLTTPLLRDRKGGPLRPAAWDEALGRVAAGIKTIRARHGADAFGIFGGGSLTNEKAYTLGKFARLAVGTANIDYNGRFCMASAAAAGIRAFGIDRGLPFPLEDIPAAETVLMVGANPAETMPPIMQYFEEQKALGGTLIVADPRQTATARAAGLHLQLTPGTDSALANGMLHIAIRDGLIDRDFIETRTNGFERVRRVAGAYWPDRVERVTGIPVRQIERATHLLGEAATAMVLTARGPEQQSHGVDNVLAFINLILALGKVGKPHCGYGCLTGQGNGQGGREHGQKADQLPGYRRLDNPQHRADVAAVWGVNADSLPAPGLSACELLDQLGKSVHGLFVMASNIVVSAPAAAGLGQRLGDLDLFVVADFFLSETAALADVVLPVTQWAEEEGTMTNLEGRILRRHKLRDPPAGVWTDLQIMQALAERLGSGGRFFGSAPATFAEFRRATAGGVADYAGVSYERIEAEDGVFWPCPSDDHPGTKRLFLDRFPTADGRAQFHAIEHRLVAEEPDEEFPYFLTTGRVLTHYQSGAQTRRIAELNDAEPAAFVEIHPDTARGLAIGDRDAVRLVTRRGTIELTARLSRGIRMDTLFVPFHWSGTASANRLTIAALDQVSRIPEFKVCAVRIEKVTLPAALAPALEAATRH